MARRIRCLSAAALIALAALGCASDPNVTTLEPTVDELPNLAYEDPGTVQAAIGVQGVRRRPSFRLVPPLPEPELTDEERQILGQSPEPAEDFLLRYNPVLPTLNAKFYPRSTTQDIARFGIPNPSSVGRTTSRTSVGVGRIRYPATGVVPVYRRNIGRAGRSASAGAVGPSSKAEVGIGPAASSVGRHRRRNP